MFIIQSNDINIVRDWRLKVAKLHSEKNFANLVTKGGFRHHQPPPKYATDIFKN